jgi:membrane-bound metal-dependent hydrolase YbcI (DUF457 family)
VPLKTRIDQKGTSCWVHASQILGIADILDRHLCAIIPTAVIELDIIVLYDVSPHRDFTHSFSSGRDGGIL